MVKNFLKRPDDSDSPEPTRQPLSSFRAKSIKSKKSCFSQSMMVVEKRAVLCQDCKRRTIDKVPVMSATGSKIETGGFKVTKDNSSQKGAVNNIWSSHIS